MRNRGTLAALLLQLVVLATPAGLGVAADGSAADRHAAGVAADGSAAIGSRLRYLQIERERPGTPMSKLDEVPISLRFEQPPSAGQLQDLVDAGVRFYDAPVTPSKISKGGRRRGVLQGPSGLILGTKRVVPARAPWSRLGEVALVRGVMRIESDYKPRRQVPLFTTRGLIGAEQAWTVTDPDGDALDGDGVLIADIDTGADVYHPDYWFSDGAVVDWIDVDLSGDYTDGDAVDANGNSVADPDELLRWWDAPGGAPGLDPSLQTHIDHFYQDVDGSAAREFGPPSFSETDPTYGEPLYRVLDTNQNNTLDIGEQLVTLNTCKVQAIYETDGTIRRRGIDLILGEGDRFGHGTNVGSILAGGSKDRRFCGIAPGAQLIFANLDYTDEHPFVTPLDVRMAWAAAEGADIIIYEDGEWIWEFLDGSSNVEILLNDLVEQGIVNASAAGNLATGGMHWIDTLGSGSVLTTLQVRSAAGLFLQKVWGDFYWIPEVDDEVLVNCQTPEGDVVTLGGVGSTQVVGPYEIYSAQDVSPRGTMRVDFKLSLASSAAPDDTLEGDWLFNLTRVSGSGDLQVNAMNWDDLSGWFGAARWETPTTQQTVTWPATADQAIVVAAYSKNSLDINSFSGRGPRHDGRSLIDVTSPGSPTHTGRRNQSHGGIPGGYGSFGGTSAALPHVAGSIALLLQWDPDLSPNDIRSLLIGGAMTDEFTGAVPNSDWGYGKLNVYDSINSGPVAVPPRTLASLGPVVLPNVPNPFNPQTELRYRLDGSGDVVLEIFDLRGRLVRSLPQGVQDPGDQAVIWDGTDGTGARVSSGIYLVRVQQNGKTAARKIGLVK